MEIAERFRVKPAEGIVLLEDRGKTPAFLLTTCEPKAHLGNLQKLLFQNKWFLT